MTGRLGSGRRTPAPPIAGVRVVLDVRPLQEPAEGADDRDLPRRAARRLRRRPARRASRSRSSSRPACPTRSRPPGSTASDRRSPGPAADPPARQRLADRRPVPAARRLGRDRVGRRARGRGRRRLSHGRRRGPARLGRAGRRDPARPRAVGAAERLPGEHRGPRSASACGRGILRDAAAVIVGSAAASAAARRLLHVRRDRIRIVRLAPRRGLPARGGRRCRPREAALLGIPGRYLVYPGRYDARQDLGTLLRALASLAAGTDGTRDRASADGRPRWARGLGRDRARRRETGRRDSCSSGRTRTIGPRSPGRRARGRRRVARLRPVRLGRAPGGARGRVPGR